MGRVENGNSIRNRGRGPRPGDPRSMAPMEDTKVSRWQRGCRDRNALISDCSCPGICRSWRLGGGSFGTGLFPWGSLHLTFWLGDKIPRKNRKSMKKAKSERLSPGYHQGKAKWGKTREFLHRKGGHIKKLRSIARQMRKPK